jgi:hypothetical protein
MSAHSTNKREIVVTKKEMFVRRDEAKYKKEIERKKEK